MTGTSFGQRLRRLREATPASDPDRPWLVGSRWASDGVLSVNGLARRARISAAYVTYLEDGTRQQPTRAVVERLCDALELSPYGRAELLVAAGYWPWPEADDATTELLVALALAVLDGDYRPLEATVRDAVVTGATLEAR